MARYGPTMLIACAGLLIGSLSNATAVTTDAYGGWPHEDARVIVITYESYDRIQFAPPEIDARVIAAVPYERAAMPKHIDRARMPHVAASALKPSSLVGWRSGRVRKLAA